jgi:hypothetical protein
LPAALTLSPGALVGSFVDPKRMQAFLCIFGQNQQTFALPWCRMNSAFNRGKLMARLFAQNESIDQDSK